MEAKVCLESGSTIPQNHSVRYSYNWSNLLTPGRSRSSLVTDMSQIYERLVVSVHAQERSEYGYMERYGA